MMPQMPQFQTDGLKTIIDNARAIAFKRGAKMPDWNDIWLGMLDVPGFADVVEDRGVDVYGLRADLIYMARFIDAGRGNAVGRHTPILEELRLNILRDLKEFRRTYLERDNGVSASDKAAVDRLATDKFERLAQFLVDRIETVVTDSEKGALYAQVKAVFLKKLVSDVLGDMGMAELDDGPLAAIGPGRIVEAIISHVGMQINVVSDNDPLALLEAIEEKSRKHPALPAAMSPLEVVDLVRGLSGQHYAQLLVRNGEYTTDPSYEDRISHMFPHKTVQRLALAALDHAYDWNSDAVDVRHMVTALLDDPDVMRHLAELGVKDLLAFRDKYVALVSEKDETEERTVRRHPRVTFNIRILIQSMDDFCDENKKDPHLASKLLRHLIFGSEETDWALNKAGLRRRMLSGWAAPYKADKEPRPGGERKEKAAGFKVQDAELNALIAQYCVDYTKLARDGAFDPMIGNQEALETVATTLLKKGKKNPMIIGEPGIGKTKILEGFAQRIVRGQVPRPLLGSRLLYLDLHAMNDMPFAGVFEGRLKKLLDGISERNASGKTPPIQIAIDEFAGAQDAGGHRHSEGAKALLKPYLTSGDLFVIGTTTRDEYQKKVESDPALARRFNVVSLQAPNAAGTVEILAGLKARYAAHHDLKIDKGLLPVVVDMAERYIHRVNQPDKSIDLLDHACAIARAQGDRALKDGHVFQAVNTVCGVPLDFLGADDGKRYATLPETLKRTILEQDAAILSLSAALQKSKAGLCDPEKPTGVFLFVGPSGVGKTELARCLATTLYGGEDFLLRYDMAEFQEKHAASRLIGAPPGYVGYEEGGALVRDVRSKPHSVVLLDEVEKAHPDIFDVLLRPFSNGILTDGRGMQANMRHTINIMTSNVGAAAVLAEGRARGLDPLTDTEAWNEMAMPLYWRAVEGHFKPEFLGRVDAVICFNTLSKAAVGTLVDRQIAVTQEQLRSGPYKLDLRLAPEFRDSVIERGFDIRYGARPLKKAWDSVVVAPLSQWLLSQPAKAVRRASAVSVVRTEEGVSRFALAMR